MLNHEWITSSYSQKGASNCVETRSAVSRTVDVRDSQHPEHGYLSFDGAEWRAFLAEAETF